MLLLLIDWPLYFKKYFVILDLFLFSQLLFRLLIEEISLLFIILMTFYLNLINSFTFFNNPFKLYFVIINAL